MKTESEIKAARKRALAMWDLAQKEGSGLSAMSYEEGLRDILDWITGDSDEDPTQQL